MRTLIPKLDFTRFFRGLEFKTCRVLVLIIGFALSLFFHGAVAHAEAVYSFTKTIGGTDQDLGQSVAVDSNGNVYITGSFRDTVDFDPEAGPDNRTSAGQEDIFLTKLNSSGSVVWTRTLGGTDADFGRSVAVDSSENVYITGSFRGTADFNPDAGIDNRTSAGLEDIFLTKLNSSGSVVWTRILGGTDADFGRSVAVDSSDSVYITGYFRDTVDFDPGAGTDNQTSAGLEDIFLTKLNSSGSVVWTRILGGTDADFGRSVAVDSSDSVYITGSFRGTADFDPDTGTDNQTSTGEEDIFLTKTNSDGSYGFTRTLGGTDADFGRFVAVDGSDNVYITGSFRGTADFDPDFVATDNRTSAGEEDIFLTKINFDGSYDLTKIMGGTDQDFGWTVAVDDSVNAHLTGSFRGTNVDFNPDIVATDNKTSVGEEDIYLTKFRMVDVVVTPTSVTTTGAGDTATFTVRLLSEPTDEVTLPVSSSNTNLGTVDTSSLTFTTIKFSVDQTVTVTSVSSSSQTYSIILDAAISADADYNGLNPTDVTVTISGNDSGGSGSCFIATAAYGSPLASHIKVLSRFRDHFLLTNGIGKGFVRFYNTYSPPMAGFMKKHDNLRAMVRLGLIPFVGASWLALKIGPKFTMVLILLIGIGLTGFVKFIWSKKKLSR